MRLNQLHYTNYSMYKRPFTQSKHTNQTYARQQTQTQKPKYNVRFKVEITDYDSNE